MALALGALAMGAVTPAAAQQVRWSYPAGAKANPLAPPAELYSAQAAPRLSVGTIVFKDEDPAGSIAVVRLVGDAGTLERRLVRAGDRIGDYQVERVAPDGVWVKRQFLGAERRMRIANVVSRDDNSAGGL